MSVASLIAACTVPDHQARIDAYTDATGADTQLVLEAIREWGVEAELRRTQRWRALLDRWDAGHERASVRMVDELCIEGLGTHPALLPADVWHQPAQVVLSLDLLPVETTSPERIAA